jgi:hypothetical protein
VTSQKEFWSTIAHKYDQVVDLQIGPKTRSMVRERLARESRKIDRDRWLFNRNKASLDIFWLRDESLEESNNLLDPREVRNGQERGKDSVRNS